MKKTLLLLALIAPLALFCQPAYWQQQVSYTIDVSLNDVEHTLDGFAKIKYSNQSPDTLTFIWFHLWPNAFKNDRTAFSEQLLQNGRTDFYFSDKEQKGYINRLDFRVDGLEAKMEDHPLYIDVCKVILPHPLAPGASIEITTPFHEKIPFHFSGGGHIGQSYQLTKWYPQPAVYDRKGWHEMPYTDQGGSYADPGNFEVHLTLPENYAIAATGELQDEAEKQWLIARTQGPKATVQKTASIKSSTNNLKSRQPTTATTNHKSQITNPSRSAKTTKPLPDPTPASAKQTKTLVYRQDHAADFVWFADKRFLVNHDTAQLATGRKIDIYHFYLPGENEGSKKTISYIKEVLHFRSAVTGEYPFNTLSAVTTKAGTDPGTNSYPALISIPQYNKEKELDLAIEHAIGFTWVSGITCTNERRNAWMTAGINTYYDNRYEAEKYLSPKPKLQDVKHKFTKATRNIQYAPAQQESVQTSASDEKSKRYLEVITTEKTDQPISTPSTAFSKLNYPLVTAEKAGLWMKQLEDSLGRTRFDSAMLHYFSNWQFKHPFPEDFRAIIGDAGGKQTVNQFALLDQKGALPGAMPKKIKPAFLFSQKNTDKFSYLSFAPAAGYNMYDKFMIGALIHNLNIPPQHFQFFAIPLYATNSKQFNGIGDISYSWYPDNKFQKIEISVGAARFSTMDGVDSNSNKIFGGFYKFTPAIRFNFKNKNARSSIEKWIELKTFLIGEKAFNYVVKSADSNYYPTKQNYTTRYLNQLTFTIDDYRVLYPYTVQLQLQQAADFYRLNFNSNYFFNYSKGGGMNVRLFAAKFGYLGGSTPAKQFATYAYQPKLTATRGDEDYTYSNYFLGRSEATGFASQQIMMKDGGLKIRTDLFQDLQGRSDNWVASVNFSTTLPSQIVPPKIPLKIFADIGTYADAWGNSPPTSKFLYVGGLQLSLFKNILNIYVPLVYSSDFGNSLKSVPEENTFWKKISFSLDIQSINFRRIFRDTPF